MPFGLLTGLGAALVWGSLDVITALTQPGRREPPGDRRDAARHRPRLRQLVIVTGTACPPSRAMIAIAALLGLIGAAAYLSYFTGLQIGPISVVSGMVAAFGGLTVVLSVLFRGESLTPLQAVGAMSRPSGSC